MIQKQRDVLLIMSILPLSRPKTLSVPQNMNTHSLPFWRNNSSTMKLAHIILIPLVGSASFTSILAAPAPDADEAQIGISSGNLIVAGLTCRSGLASHIGFISIHSSVDPPNSITVNSAPGLCKSYTDCLRCKSGYWRCCVAGCAGREVPGSHTCLCIQDGHKLPQQCGCT